jgi:uncharacterized protein with HEPN domain
MTERNLKYLNDILLAIELIEYFTEDVNDFYSYEIDLKTQSAVERKLAVIGEALNQLKKSDQTITIKNDYQIIGFRNRLIHSYDSIDNSIVWAILQNYIKPLKEEIESLVN